MATDRWAKPGFILSLQTCMHTIQSLGKGWQVSVLFGSISWMLVGDIWSDEKSFEAR